MRRRLAALCRRAGESFGDHLLQRLLLLVIAAAFVFAVVFDAGAPVVFGVLVAGGIAAFAEAAYHRRRK